MKKRVQNISDSMPRRSFRVLLIAAVIGVICLFFWSFTYTVSRTVEADGILFSGEPVHRRIMTHDDTVREVLVSVGDHVEEGTVLAVISNGDLLSEIVGLQEALEGAPDDRSLQNELEGLKERYISESFIRSDCSGQVNQVQQAGAWLNAGETVVSVLPDTGYTDLLAFVPLWQLNEISTGMTVKIYPEFAPREKYGLMFGTVSRIERVPATEEALAELMGSSAYAADLLPNMACSIVHIRVWIDPESENGYYWSNKNGRSLPVAADTVCSVDIITEEYHPASLLLP